MGNGWEKDGKWMRKGWEMDGKRMGKGWGKYGGNMGKAWEKGWEKKVPDWRRCHGENEMFPARVS
jgi:hypothetical protein